MGFCPPSVCDYAYLRHHAVASTLLRVISSWEVALPRSRAPRGRVESLSAALTDISRELLVVLEVFRRDSPRAANLAALCRTSQDSMRSLATRLLALHCNLSLIGLPDPYTVHCLQCILRNAPVIP